LKGRSFFSTQKTGVAVNTMLPERVLRSLEHSPKVTATHYFWDGEQQIEIAIGRWRRCLAKLFELTGVSGAHPHRFRDTFAVELPISAPDGACVDIAWSSKCPNHRQTLRALGAIAPRATWGGPVYRLEARSCTF
jgi:hypothetical protein